MKFFKFNENMFELLYSSDKYNFVVKTKSGDIITCELNWHQGRYNNYRFRSEFFNQDVPIDDIDEIDLTGINAFFIDYNAQVQHLSMFDGKYNIIDNTVEILDDEGFVIDTSVLYESFDKLDKVCTVSVEQTMDFFCRIQSRKMKPLDPEIAKLLSENIAELF